MPAESSVRKYKEAKLKVLFFTVPQKKEEKKTLGKKQVVCIGKEENSVYLLVCNQRDYERVI